MLASRDGLMAQGDHCKVALICLVIVLNVYANT